MSDDDKLLNRFRRRSEQASKESGIPDEQSGQIGPESDLQLNTQGLRTPYGRVEVRNEFTKRRRLFDLHATLRDDYEPR